MIILLCNLSKTNYDLFNYWLCYCNSFNGLLYSRYSEFRVKAANERMAISEKYESELKFSTGKANDRYLTDLQTKTQQANDILREIDELRKKKMRTNLRLNTEKQVELSLQKTKDIEKRIQDWL